MKHLPLLLSTLVLLAAPFAQAQSLTERAESGELAFMASEEPAMRRAFEKAGSTLDEFFRIAANPPEGASSFNIKVAVSDGRNTEYFWVKAFAPTASGYEGELANAPRMVRKYQLGDRISFDRKHIVDWMYVDDDDRMHGNFTACALLSKEPPAQARAFMKRYGLACD